MPNQYKIPFTEQFERVMYELVRDKASNTAMEPKYKGAINDVYMADFLTLPEDYLRKTGTFRTIGDYVTGSITVANGGATIVGVATAWTSANSNDGLLKATDTETVFRVAYSGALVLTMGSPATWVDAALTAKGYRIIFDRYALVSDFGHMVIDDIDDPEAVYWWTGGARQHLTPQDNGEFERDFSFAYGTPDKYTVKYIDTDPYMYIWPADDITRSIFYEYIPMITGLTEYTTGTASCTNGATAVTGTSTDWDGYLSTTEDYYLRFDGDGTGSASVWYKISTYTGDTSITLSSAYNGATKSAASYTISKVSKYPAKYDTALIYGAALRVDPSNTDAQRWANIYLSLMPTMKGIDGSRIQGKKGSYKRA